jgi:hypothetical protein
MVRNTTLKRLSGECWIVRHPKVFLWLMLLLPFLSVPLLGKKSLKRFLPAALFMALLVKYEGKIAKKRKWWWYFEQIHPKVSGGFPLTWGPFLVGSMWILKLTYGKFWIYTIVNLIIDSGFTYLFLKLLHKLGIGTLVRLKKYQLSLLFFFKSMLLYGVQYLVDKLRKQY